MYNINNYTYKTFKFSKLPMDFGILPLKLLLLNSLYKLKYYYNKIY